MGNEWTLIQCAVVISTGQALNLVGYLFLLTLSDDYALSESELTKNKIADDATAHTAELETESDPEDSEKGDAYNLLEDADETEEEAPLLCIRGDRVVAVMVATHDFVTGIGTGMTSRYFLVFIMSYLNLDPVHTYIVYLLIGLGMTACHKVTQLVGQCIGKLQAVVFMEWCGIFFNGLMNVSYRKSLFPTPIIAGIIVLRYAFMQSTDGLTKSVLLNNVPKQERGKWSALESVNRFGWSGSGMIGGLLVQTGGILFAFQITMLIEFIATIPLILIFRRAK